MWLRLTSLFGLPEEGATPDDIICGPIGVIIRADAQALLEEPLPPQLASLLRQLAEQEHRLRKGAARAAARCDGRLNTASTEQAFVTRSTGPSLRKAPHLGRLTDSSMLSP